MISLLWSSEKTVTTFSKPVRFAQLVRPPLSSLLLAKLDLTVCSLAGFWRLKDKIGLTFDDIHFKGAVPNYAEKYQKSLNRFLTNMKIEKIVERNNVRSFRSVFRLHSSDFFSSLVLRRQYFFQVDSGLDWSTGTNGSEKIFDQFNKGPEEGSLKANPNAEKPTAATECVHFLSLPCSSPLTAVC
jgi:hypothetical protein